MCSTTDRHFYTFVCPLWCWMGWGDGHVVRVGLVWASIITWARRDSSGGWLECRSVLYHLSCVALSRTTWYRGVCLSSLTWPSCDHHHLSVGLPLCTVCASYGESPVFCASVLFLLHKPVWFIGIQNQCLHWLVSFANVWKHKDIVASCKLISWLKIFFLRNCRSSFGLI